LFVNCDYYPTSMENNTDGIDPINRIYQMSEMIVSVILKNKSNITVTMLAIGTPAKYFLGLASERLRHNEVTVKSMHCKQPVSLSRITTNRDKIGLDENYMFCDEQVIRFFEIMVSSYSKVSRITEEEILSKMTTGKSTRIPDDTKTGLDNILSDLERQKRRRIDMILLLVSQTRIL
jgi:hypothetical protein